MLLIGLTGGIASGKTLVSDRFHALGVPVIDADLLARKVVEPGTQGLEEVVARFGDEVLHADGTLDRQALRTAVFADDEARAALDAMLHPRIRKLSEQRIRDARETGAPYAIYAVPLLVETDQVSRFDRVLVVDVPVQVQIARLVQRDGIDEAAAHRILAAQATREQRLAVADDVIENSGTAEATGSSVDRLAERYLRMEQVRERTVTSETFNRVAGLVPNGQYKISTHALGELLADELTAMDVIHRIDDSELLEDYPDFPTGRSVLVLNERVDGRPVHTVWGIPEGYDAPAVLITAYVPDPGKWSDDFRSRLDR